MPPAPAPAPFRLRRWFALLGALVIALIAVSNAWLVSSFLTDQLFRREAAVAADFVQNVLVSDESLEYLARPSDPALRARFQNSIAHLGNMRDVLRANVYGPDRSVLWSSDAQLIGRRFGDNDELDEAMRGELVVHAGRIEADERGKREHEGLSPAVAFFVETYIPVQRPGSRDVLGVVELYKAPLALTDAIHEGQRRVALAALAGALALYLSLFWLVHRAERTIRQQQAQLLQAETLAAIGELAASVAHNIRNPLASIRSSAELSLEAPAEHAAEGAADILREVDRISARITELLRLASPAHDVAERVDLAALLRACVADHEETFRRRQQALTLATAAAQGAATADPKQLEQVLHSVLDNASEAMPAGRSCHVSLLEVPPRHLRIEVRDEGSGIAPEVMAQVFRPFFTTKSKGLGLGLPLARRIIERLGGSLQLSSEPGSGTCVRIDLPKA